MPPELIDHLWQSTLFVGAAWVLTLALRKNQAQVRYWVWFTASMKFLIPFSLLVGLGTLMPRRSASPPVQAQWVVAAEQIGEPLTTFPANAARVVAADRPNGDYFAAAALALWTCGFAAIAMCWLVRWKRVHALRRSAALAKIVEFPVPVMFAPGLIEPGIVGILRPVLLLPEGIAERLDRAQLDAILAHELCHVHRRDNLTASIHMIVQAIFWFHPLVWWLGARLVDERERACDEEVLRIFGQPKAYAEGILNVCKLYVESRLACVSGVTGSNLKKRIEAIMKNRIVQQLNGGKKLLLAGAGIMAMTVPIAVGILSTPRIRAQSVSAPKFEVASIKPCKPAPEVAGRRSGGIYATPRMLHVSCMPVKFMIQTAYVTFANDRGRLNYEIDPATGVAPVAGGPAWMSSDRYDIEAKAEGSPSGRVMQGPMLQTLLEDRFKLKLRRDTKEIQVYNLAVAKNGFKLQPLKDGSCTPFDPLAPVQPGPEICGTAMLRRPQGPGKPATADFRGISLDIFSQNLGRPLDRPVINKTGIAGIFDFHLEFAPDQATPGLLPASTLGAARSDYPAFGGPSIFTAFQEQLGLKLESAKGPGTFLVVDSVERPSEN